MWDDQTRDGLYATVSEDGGKSWMRNVRASDRSTVGITDFFFETTDDKLYLVWADLVDGAGDNVYFVEGRFSSP
jgi:hypothetical protein